MAIVGWVRYKLKEMQMAKKPSQSQSSGIQSATNYDNSLVAVFDEYGDAKRAVDALGAAGFGAQNIQLNPQEDSSEFASDPNNPSDSRTSSVSSSDAKGENSHQGGIGGFFRSLFGGDDDRQYHDVYAESVRRGHYVLSFDAQDEDQLHRASDIISQYNPVDIDERSSAWKQQGWTGYDASAPRFSQDEITRDRASYASLRSSDTQSNIGDKQRTSTLKNETRIPVVEEEMKVGKREVERGGVRVVKRVRETPVNESIQLRDEHVKVERRPASGDAALTGRDAFKEESFELRESAEEAVVSKNARVVEEVVVGKEVNQRTENVKDSVRRTDVDVEQLGSANLRDGATRMDDDSDFRSHWQTNFGSGGGRYEDYAPAYSYGSTLAGNDRYSGRKWEELEPQMRSDWESSHPGSAWDKVKDAVRYGSERATGSRRQ
jgi:uncharacterized protein (TIGR02271 family)